LLTFNHNSSPEGPRSCREPSLDPAEPCKLERIFAGELSLASSVRRQKKHQDAPKVYSLHASEVECIAKGKAHKSYEFGCKVSVTTTNVRAPGGHFVLHIDALHGRPHDGHTLNRAIDGTEGNDRQ